MATHELKTDTEVFTHTYNGLKDFEKDDVQIFLDLKTDEYTFTAPCPFCNHQIINKRRAFK